MDFEDKINHINNPSFVDRRINQIKYLIFEGIGLPKDNIVIKISPRGHRSNFSERLTDIWNIDFYIDISTEVEPGLSEIASFLDGIEKNIYNVFKNVGIDQFMDFVTNPDQNLYGLSMLVSKIEYNVGEISVEINIDYETITVEGAGGL